MKKFIILISCCWITSMSFANNVTLQDISLVGTPGNMRVKFDLVWDYSWHVSTGQSNYDGVWVFFKYRANGGEWKHLNMTGTNNLIPNNPLFNNIIYQNTGAFKTGAIIHPTADYISFSNPATDVELGVTDIIGFNVEIRGYAIEMVYIPECANCVIGDGNGVSESTNAFHLAGIDNKSASLDLTYKVDVNDFDDDVLENEFAINSFGISGNNSWVTGQELWCMKYEISQGAYRDFLNTLSVSQQANHTIVSPASPVGTAALIAGDFKRNSIEIAVPSSGEPAIYGCDANNNNVFNEAGDGEWVACNYLSWADVAAYLDWAGLAPMTEIVFERICRGGPTGDFNPSFLGEYAWGTASIANTAYTLGSGFTASEIASNASASVGNANYDLTAPTGVLRNGIFATSSSDRITSGSSFYGVMEMSGNVAEPTITVGNVAGRAFTSLNGDGLLSANGYANTANWPCSNNPAIVPSCSEVTGSGGTILKGGSINHSALSLRVSDRSGEEALTSRSSGQGGRGVLYIY